MTVTHTIGVFALGLVTLALSEFIVPEQLYPWLNLVSALLVVAVGVGVVRCALAAPDRAARRHTRTASSPPRHTARPPRHDHRRTRPGLRGLLGVGISGGILPCPTALVVLLAAISLHRVGYGLVLIVAFSLGLAAAITAIGLSPSVRGAAFARVSFEGGSARAPGRERAVVSALGSS